MLRKKLPIFLALGATSLVPAKANARPFFLKFFDYLNSFASSPGQSAATPAPVDPMSMIPQQLLSSPSATPDSSSSPSPSPSASASPSATPIAGVNGFGAPLPGLSGDELRRFVDGQQAFIQFVGPQNGLGVLFNSQSCTACHTQPTGNQPLITPTGPDTPAMVQDITVGGGSSFTELRAVRTGPDGSVTFLLPNSGSLFHLSSLPALTPTSNGQLPDNILSQEGIPLEANTRAHRRSNALFGFGLIEAIPDDAIRANVKNPPIDGVRGRVSDLSNDPVTQAVAASGTAPKNFVGRFGWKAQHSTLTAFSSDAYLFEQGVTNQFNGRDLAPNGNEQALIDAEPLGFTTDSPDTLVKLPPNSNQDVEGDIFRFADFMRFLAPGPALVQTQSSINGGRIFSQIGCTLCHVPSMQTGASSSPALAFQNVPAFSDFLLHDLGPELHDGIPQAAAGPNEMRTAPLGMGLLRSRSGGFLHDARALTLMDAVKAHGGEATTVISRFNALSTDQQQQVISFLMSI